MLHLLVEVGQYIVWPKRGGNCTGLLARNLHEGYLDFFVVAPVSLYFSKWKFTRFRDERQAV